MDKRRDRVRGSLNIVDEKPRLRSGYQYPRAHGKDHVPPKGTACEVLDRFSLLEPTLPQLRDIIQVQTHLQNGSR